MAAEGAVAVAVDADDDDEEDRMDDACAASLKRGAPSNHVNKQA